MKRRIWRLTFSALQCSFLILPQAKAAGFSSSLIVCQPGPRRFTAAGAVQGTHPVAETIFQSTSCPHTDGIKMNGMIFLQDGATLPVNGARYDRVVRQPNH